jgi:hypothetical protein
MTITTPNQAPAGAEAPDHVDNTAVGYPYDGGYMTTVGIPARKIGTPTTPPGDFGLGLGQTPYAWISPPDPPTTPSPSTSPLTLGY